MNEAIPSGMNRKQITKAAFIAGAEAATEYVREDIELSLPSEDPNGDYGHEDMNNAIGSHRPRVFALALASWRAGWCSVVSAIREGYDVTHGCCTGCGSEFPLTRPILPSDNEPRPGFASEVCPDCFAKGAR
jgi:hypothetical protein